MPMIDTYSLKQRIEREVVAVEEHDEFKALRNMIRIMGDVLTDVANNRHVNERLRENAAMCRYGYDKPYRMDRIKREEERARRQQLRYEQLLEAAQALEERSIPDRLREPGMIFIEVDELDRQPE